MTVAVTPERRFRERLLPVLYAIGMTSGNLRAPDTLHRILQSIWGFAATGARLLGQRGITPTLGIFTTITEDLATEFLQQLDKDAANAGVLIKRVDTSSEPHGGREPQRSPYLAALETLPDRWDPMGDEQLAAAAHELREFGRRHSTAQAMPGCRDEQVDLGAWLTRQRLDHIRGAVDLLVEDPTVHGVICPPPLPPGLTARQHIVQLVPEHKDVDGVHPGTLGALFLDVVFPENVTLSEAGCHAKANRVIRLITSAMIVAATIAAAQRRHRAALSASTS